MSEISDPFNTYYYPTLSSNNWEPQIDLVYHQCKHQIGTFVQRMLIDLETYIEGVDR